MPKVVRSMEHEISAHPCSSKGCVTVYVTMSNDSIMSNDSKDLRYGGLPGVGWVGESGL